MPSKNILVCEKSAGNTRFWRYDPGGNGYLPLDEAQLRREITNFRVFNERAREQAFRRFPGSQVDVIQELPDCIRRARAERQQYRGKPTAQARGRHVLEEWDGAPVRVAEVRERLEISPSAWKELMKQPQLRQELDTRGVLHSALHQAVLSLQPGCDLKPLQQNLGHYAAAFTLDTYGQVTHQMRREGAEKINRFLEKLESQNRSKGKQVPERKKKSCNPCGYRTSFWYARRDSNSNVIVLPPVIPALPLHFSVIRSKFNLLLSRLLP